MGKNKRGRKRKEEEDRVRAAREAALRSTHRVSTGADNWADELAAPQQQLEDQRYETSSGGASSIESDAYHGLLNRLDISLDQQAQSRREQTAVNKALVEFMKDIQASNQVHYQQMEHMINAFNDLSSSTEHTPPRSHHSQRVPPRARHGGSTSTPATSTGATSTSPSMTDTHDPSSGSSGANGTQRNEPPFLVRDHAFTGGSIKPEKFTKALGTVSIVPSDRLVDVRNVWDELNNALGMALVHPRPLPDYMNLNRDFNILEHLLPPTDHGSFRVSLQSLQSFSSILRTELSGGQFITAKSPLLHRELMIHQSESCGFVMLQKIIFNVSPHLGGKNRDLVQLIEQFDPENGEESSVYFTRALDLYQDGLLQRLPSATLNRLIRRFVEGFNKDPRFSPHVASLLSKITKHDTSADNYKDYPVSLASIYRHLDDRSAPTTINLTSPDDEFMAQLHSAITRQDVRLPAPIANSLTSNEDSPTSDDGARRAAPVALRSSFSRPPSRSNHRPPSRQDEGNDSRNSRPSSTLCPACGFHHPRGPQWCHYRGPDFIYDPALRQRVLQYNVQHGDTNPLLEEVAQQQVNRRRLPSPPVLPSDAPRRQTRFASVVTEIPTYPSSQQDDEIPFDESFPYPDEGLPPHATPYHGATITNVDIPSIYDIANDPDEYFNDLETPPPPYSRGFFAPVTPTDASPVSIDWQVRKQTEVCTSTTIAKAGIINSTPQAVVSEPNEFPADVELPTLLPSARGLIAPVTSTDETADTSSPGPSPKSMSSTVTAPSQQAVTRSHHGPTVSAAIASKAHERLRKLQQTLSRMPRTVFRVLTTVDSHVDGGANSHIVPGRQNYLWYKEERTEVGLANGTMGISHGYGCVLCRIADTNLYMPLFPAFDMNNPWPTFSPPATKRFNGYGRVRVDSLEALEIVDDSGVVHRVPTNVVQQGRMNLDFIPLTFVTLNEAPPTVAAVVTRSHARESTPTSFGPHPSPTNVSTPPAEQPPTIGSPTPDDVQPPIETSTKTSTVSTPTDTADKIIVSQNEATRRATIQLIHQRLGHIGYNKLSEMARRGLLRGLPKTIQIPHEPCLVCLQAKARGLPHGKTNSTDHLLPGQRLHMDFAFVDVVSVRKMTANLAVIDAKTHKLWNFTTRNKRPPLDIMRFLWQHLTRQGRQLMQIFVDAAFASILPRTRFITSWRTWTSSKMPKWFEKYKILPC